MITDELLAYIKAQQSRGTSRDVIAAKLAESGWHPEDIEEGLRKIFVAAPGVATAAPVVSSAVPLSAAPAEKKIVSALDSYREPVTSAETDLSRFNAKPVSTMQTGWTPPISTAPLESKPAAARSPYVSGSAVVNEQPAAAQEFMPTLVPKAAAAPAPEVQPLSESAASFASFRPTRPPASSVEILTPETYSPNPSSVVTSSYKRDYQVAKATTPKSGHSLLGWVIGVILIIGLFGGGAYAYTKGYIKLPFELPFLQKDPRQVLAALPAKQAAVTSWKSEGDISLTTPSLSHIIGMLLANANAAVVSSDTDSIAIRSVNSISTLTKGAPQASMMLSVKSSLLPQPVSGEVRIVNNVMYAGLPDLSAVVPKSIALPEGWVSLPTQDVDSLLALFPNTSALYGLSAKKESLSALLGQPDLASKMSVLSAQAFQNMQITQKPDEVIHGVSVYHYGVVADTDTVRTFVQGVVALQPSLLSAQESAQLTAILNTLSVNSLDIWVGKSDNLLYKYDINATLPLDKVFNLKDQNLSNTNLTIQASQTYYDYNVPVTVQTPDAATSALGVVKGIQNSLKDSDTETTMQTFAVDARELLRVEGTYGPKSNISGSCTNPIAGTVFSPLGHKTAASNAVGTLSSDILHILNNTNGAGYCYSTSRAWAIAIPLSATPSMMFCADSAGAFQQMTTPITGPVCK